MVDIAKEKLIALADVPKFLPKRRGGKRVNIATLYRWVQRGCKDVHLEALQVGGTKCTSLEALQRFFERLSARSGNTVQSRTPTQRQRAAEKDNAELAALGW